MRDNIIEEMASSKEGTLIESYNDSSKPRRSSLINIPRRSSLSSSKTSFIGRRNSILLNIMQGKEFQEKYKIKEVDESEDMADTSKLTSI
jgi:hypothetical protein